MIALKDVRKHQELTTMCPSMLQKKQEIEIESPSNIILW
jgi:hypothetical protein